VTLLAMLADWYRNLSHDTRLILWMLLLAVAAAALMIGYADTWTDWF
jgi:hypothetical protein